MSASPASPELSLFPIAARVDLVPEGTREKIRKLIPRLAEDECLADGPLELKAGAHWVPLNLTPEEFEALRGRQLDFYETDASKARAAKLRRESLGG